MAVECDVTIDFGTAGNSLGFLGGGWAPSEAKFTWGIGAVSHLVFPRQEAIGEYILTLDVISFVHLPDLPTPPGRRMFRTSGMIVRWRSRSPE